MVRRSLTVLFAALVLIPSFARSGTLSTDEIVAGSISTDCLEWKISGICIWLKCSLFGCWIVTTPKISHRLPDFVVAAYPNSRRSPWCEAARRIFKNEIDNTVEGGSISGTSTARLLNDALQFNEVDVIGGPASQLPGVNRFLCQSKSQPYFPYFVSLRDAVAWRSGWPDSERLEARHPGVREIGSWPTFTWGAIYPRSGFVTQTNPGKAAAVAAQRAVDIVLNDSTGHVSERLGNASQYQVVRGDRYATSADSCRLSGGRWQQMPKINDTGECVPQVWHQWLPTTDEKTDRWQLLSPHLSKHCETFGEQLDWPHESIAKDGAYVWNYWARYKCCIKAGGILLKHFDF